jgi:hypothetical protein
LSSLAGTWSLIVTMHRRGAPVCEKLPEKAPAAATMPDVPSVAAVAAPAPEPEPKPAPPPPPPPAEDPTEAAVSRITTAKAEQLEEARAADAKAEALERARQSAVAETERARRRVMLVRTQIEKLADEAKRLETEMGEVALERDVLAQERDATKAALAKARNRSSYAVLPHKGPNGTWRRPVIIECRNGEAVLQPNGPTFTMLDLSTILGPRASPIVAAVAREVVRAQGLSSPDGAPVVPYIFFVVRPDGIRPYYNARAQLEPLGIAFGYELVDQNLEIDYPDLDNLDEWDGTGAPRPATPAAPPAYARSGRGGSGTGDSPQIFVWPARPGTGPTGDGGAVDGTPGPREGSGVGAGGGSTSSVLGAPDGSRPRGPFAARNGLGRGGSGVDLVPRGTPLNDPGNVYDPTSGPGRTPGTPGGGLAPGFGSSPAPSGRAPGGLPSGGEGGAAPTPGSGPRLIPLSPDVLPGLEQPGAAASGAARSATHPSPGGWRSVGRGTNPASAGDPRSQAGAPGASDLAQLAPAGSGGSPSSGSPGIASAVAGQPPPQGQAAGAGGASRPGAPRTASGAGNFDPQLGTPPPQLNGANFDASQGAPPPLSQLARLAGAMGMTPSQSSITTPPTAPNATSALGLPVPLPMPNQNGTDSEDDWEARLHPDPKGGQPKPRSKQKRELTIEVPFEMVVACGPEGVVIHPGGFRISTKAMKSNNRLLLKNLKSVLQTRRQVDPMIHPVPSVRFLVEPGGIDTYREARRQTILSGVDWPVALQVSDSDIIDTVAPREAP